MSQSALNLTPPKTTAPSSKIPPEDGPRTAVPAVTLAVLFALVVWGYWTIITEMVERWYNDPQYNHGFLVPVFSAFLLWLWRAQFPGFAPRWRWSGTLLVLGGAALRLGGTYFFYNWLELLSLIPTAAGICVLLCGWPGLRWAWPAIAFLLFMMPLPYRLQTALAYPLQRIATVSSTYVLQTIGYGAYADGTTIYNMGSTPIQVVQACSGLTMLLTFFALSTAVALIIQRPLRDRIVIFISAIPVALLANIARITITGICYKTFSAELAHAVFHTFAGWLMMPFALAVLALELYLLSRLFLEVKTEPALALGRSRALRPPLIRPARGLKTRKR
jgi:exosortase